MMMMITMEGQSNTHIQALEYWAIIESKTNQQLNVQTVKVLVEQQFSTQFSLSMLFSQ